MIKALAKVFLPDRSTGSPASALKPRKSWAEERKRSWNADHLNSLFLEGLMKDWEKTGESSPLMLLGNHSIHARPWHCRLKMLDLGRHTRLSDFTLTFHFHALEKEMATHSSVLAWRIPGTGEPGGCRLWGGTESDTTEATAGAAGWQYLRSALSSSKGCWAQSPGGAGTPQW